MPNPKTRHSKTRGRKRRTHYKLDTPNVINCTQCGAPTLMHHVCGDCGYYRGKPMVASKVSATEAGE